MGPSFSGKQSSHQTQQNNKKQGSSSNRSAPRLPQQETKSSTKQLAPTENWVRKTLKTGFAQKGLPSCPVAISRKVSLKPKHCASATLIQKTLKNEPKQGDHMHSLVKEQKKALSRPIFGPSGGTKNETAKSQNPQQRPTSATNKKLELRLFEQPASELETEEACTCEA